MDRSDRTILGESMSLGLGLRLELGLEPTLARARNIGSVTEWSPPTEMGTTPASLIL